KRGALAIGGMAAQIPIKEDEYADEEAFNKVRADKKREVTDGHDGTWVAHPKMVHFVKNIFDKRMSAPNQINNKIEIDISQKDLLQTPKGNITEKGLRTNISVGIRYIGAWLKGEGAAPINNLMEDAATAEISRAQVWQRIRHPKGNLDDGREVTFELFDRMLDEEMEKSKYFVGEEEFSKGTYEASANVFDDLVKSDT